MRFYLLILAAGLAAAGAAGGERVALPGFSMAAPDGAWVLRDNGPNQTKDGSVFDQYEGGAFVLHFATTAAPFQKGSGNSAYIKATGAVYPVMPNDARAVLDRLKAKLEREAQTGTARNTFTASAFSEAAVDGVACLRWRYRTEDRGVPGHAGEAFNMLSDEVMCPHPDFPAFVVTVMFSTRMAPGVSPISIDADGFSAQQSLKFARLGYRVRVIPLGELPQGVTEADGSIWVAYGGTSGRVARVDPKTDAVTAVVPVGRLPVGIAADESGVWVVNRGDSSVSHIDPKTDKTVATINVPDGPALIAAGGGALWVTSARNGSVVRIDPAGDTVTEISLGSASVPAGIAFAGGMLYVADYQDGRIFRIDPATNKVTGKLKGPRFAQTLMADGHYLWAVAQEPPATGPCLFCTQEDRSATYREKKTAIWRIDLDAPDVPLMFDHAIGNRPYALARWGGKVWATNWTGASLSMFDPNVPANSAFVPIGTEPVFLAAAQGALWVTVSGPARALMRLDPR